MKKHLRFGPIVLIIASFLFSGGTCKDENSLFGPIGDHFSAPISLAVDTTRNRAYVVNSNDNYAYTDATLSILDITNPAAPVLLEVTGNPISIPSYSGEIYFDATTQQAYISNRLSDNNTDIVDNILKINLDESSPTFGETTQYATAEDPFGLTCCDTSGRIYTVNTSGSVSVFDPATPTTSVNISLAVTVSNGDSFSGANSTFTTIMGHQAFVTNENGRIYVFNTDEVGDTSKHPLDYLIIEGELLRGIANDGTHLYVVDARNNEEGLLVLDPSTLTAVTPDSASITEIDISTIQTAKITLGNNPDNVLIYNSHAYVTNRDDDTVSVIDLASNTVTNTITVGDEPFGLSAFSSGGTNYLYVTNLKSNSISVINLDTNTVITTLNP